MGSTTKYALGSDLFVSRLAADGASLLASTYLGGFGTDGFSVFVQQFVSGPVIGLLPYSDSQFLGDVQLDAAGQVLVASCTSSRDFVGVSAAASQPRYGGGYGDAVVCCLSPDLTRLVWGTYLGGSQLDAAYSLALAPGGDIYVGGGTASPDFPNSTGFAAEPPGGTDGFVSRLSSGGVVLTSARLGTRAGHEQVSLLSLTETGDVLLLGLGQLPITGGCYATPGGNFLAQLSPDLQTRRFQTTFGALGAPRRLDPVALGVDACGSVYTALVGSTRYDGLPTTPGSFPAGRRNFYAVRFSPGIRSLEAAWVLPGNHVHGTSRVGPEGRFYLAVCGSCDRDGSFSLPPGVNTYADIPQGSKNCNDASLLLAFQPAAAQLLPPQVLCADAPPVLLGGIAGGGTWRGPGVEPAPGGYQFRPGPALVGTHTLSYSPPLPLPAGCAVPATLTQQFTVLAPGVVRFAPLPNPTFCASGGPGSNAYTTPLNASPPGGYFTGPGVDGGYFYPYQAGPGTHTLTYTLPGASGVCGTATQTVTVLGSRLRVGPIDTALCGTELRAFQLRASPAGGTWSGYGVSPSGRFNPAVVYPTRPLVTWLTYSYPSPDGCLSKADVRIALAQVPPSITLPPPPRCTLNPDINFYAPYVLNLPGFDDDAEYSWNFGDGTFSSSYVGRIPPLTYTYRLPGTCVPQLTIRYLLCCSRTIQYAPFTIGEAQPLPNIITPNGDGLNETFVQRQFCEPPRLQIFSRWGQRVYEAAAYDNSWNASGLPAGLYYYLFKDTTDGRLVKGWVEVLR